MACEYCKEDNYSKLKPTEEPDHFDVTVFTSEFMRPCISVTTIYEPIMFYPINYCPMCGEKLGDTNE